MINRLWLWWIGTRVQTHVWDDGTTTTHATCTCALTRRQSERFMRLMRMQVTHPWKGR